MSDRRLLEFSRDNGYFGRFEILWRADGDREKRRGRCRRVQVAISRWSCSGEGGGGRTQV